MVTLTLVWAACQSDCGVSILRSVTYNTACKFVEEDNIEGVYSLIQYNPSSKHKGVSWHKNNRKWQAFYTKDKKSYYLGSFKTEEEAIEARKKHDKKVENLST